MFRALETFILRPRANKLKMKRKESRGTSQEERIRRNGLRGADQEKWIKRNGPRRTDQEEQIKRNRSRGIGKEEQIKRSGWLDEGDQSFRTSSFISYGSRGTTDQ